MTRPFNNAHLIEMALKQAFVPAGGDPAMGGGDPAAGGAPPADPAAGGAPPADPAAGGAPPAPAGGGIDPSMLGPMIQQAVQQAMGGAGGAPGAAGAAGGQQLKPKIDINVAVMLILKLLARIVDALKIPVPASEMAATAGDLTTFAQSVSAPPAPGANAAPPADPAAAGGASGAIAPIQPATLSPDGGQKSASVQAGELASLAESLLLLGK